MSDASEEVGPSRRSYLKVLAASLGVGAISLGSGGPESTAGVGAAGRGDGNGASGPANGDGGPTTPTDGDDDRDRETPESRFGTTVDLVEDAGADPTGAEPVGAAVESAMAPDTRIEVPPGTYQLAPRPIEVPADNIGFVATDPSADTVFRFDEGYHGPFLRCERDALLFKGIDVDMSGSARESGYMRIQAPSRFRVEDVEYIGRGQGPGFAFQVAVTEDSDGVGTLRNVRVPHGSRPDRYAPPGGEKGNGRIGVYAGLTHHGTLRIQNCEFSEFGNNGVYASRTPGDVRVEDSYFLNNGPNSIRLSGAGSWAKRCLVELDFDEYSGPPTGTEWGAWGISCENAQEGRTANEYPPEEPGMLVEDCRVEFRKLDDLGVAGAAIRLASKARSMVVRNTEIRVDTERGFGRSTHAVLRVNPFLDHRMYRLNRPDPPEPHSITLENVTVTGSAAGDAAVRIAHAADSTIRNCRIRGTGDGRVGIRVIESPGCRIVGGSVDTPGYPLVVDAKSAAGCAVALSENPEFTTTGDLEATRLEGSDGSRLDRMCRALYADDDQPVTVQVADIRDGVLYGVSSRGTDDTGATGRTPDSEAGQPD